MIDIILAYISGCDKDRLEVIGKAVIKRQDVLRNSEELRRRTLQQGIIKKM